MTKTIHPAATASALKFGCQILATADGQFRLLNIETQLLSEDTFDKVAEATEELRRIGVAGVTWEKPATPKGPRSGVMPIGYHRVYSANEFGPGCNDAVDITLREETRVTLDDDVKGDTMDLAVLVAIGTECGLFRQEWARLNPGMQRMNLANRIRGFLRNNAEATLRIGSVISRFGVVANPTKEEKKAAKVAARPAKAPRVAKAKKGDAAQATA